MNEATPTKEQAKTTEAAKEDTPEKTSVLSNRRIFAKQIIFAHPLQMRKKAEKRGGVAHPMIQIVDAKTRQVAQVTLGSAGSTGKKEGAAMILMKVLEAGPSQEQLKMAKARLLADHGVLVSGVEMYADEID